MLDNYPNDWTPPKKFAAQDDNWSGSSVRHYIANAEKFGLGDAIIRAGGKILVSPSRWYACLQLRTRERGLKNRRCASGVTR